MEHEDSKLPRLITANEVARQTGIPEWRVYERVRAGDLPHVRIGRAVRFDPAAVRAWIENGGTSPGPEGES